MPVYVNDGNSFKEIAPGTGAITNLFSVQLPTALAVDTHGYLYYGTAMNGTLWKEPTAGGQQPAQVTQTGSWVTGIAVDVPGDVAFDCSGCRGPGQVTVASNQMQSPASAACSGTVPPASCFPSNNSGEEGVAYDSHGDVFWVDPGNNRVVEAPNGAGPESNVGTGLQSPFGVATDQAGDVFISDALGVLKVPANGGPQARIGSGLKPSGIAADAAGDVFVADTANHRVVEIPSNSGPQFVIASLYDPVVIAVADPFDTQPWTQ